MRTFTLDEAQSLLPVLESLLKRAMEGKRSAQSVESGINSLVQRIYFSGGLQVNPADVAKQRAEMEAHLKRVRESIAEIDAIGVQVKDLESGLLDFPCRVDDQVVLLCWRVGEPAIEYWHTLEAGFSGPAAGRRPFPPPRRRRRSSQLILWPHVSSPSPGKRKPAYHPPMCGRFARRSTREVLADWFGVDLEELPPFAPSYNVAPQSAQPIVRLGRDTAER